MYALVSTGYKVAKMDTLRFKRVGLKIMATILQLFWNCFEQDDSDSEDDTRQKKPRLPTGPLKLEEYEAQVQSVITSCMAEPAHAIFCIEEICRLIELFLGLDICSDEHLVKIILQAMFGNLAQEPAKADMSFVG